MKTHVHSNKLHLIGVFVCLWATVPALAQWEEILNQFPLTYDEISCPTPLICFAGGSQSMVKTTDGGETWKTVNYTPTNQVQYLHCLDANTCILGDNGFMKTTDGGQTWQPLTSSTAKLGTNFSFLGSNIMFSMYSELFDNFFYKSTDGGANWIRIITDLPVLMNGGAYHPLFLDENIGLCYWADGVTDTQRLYRTANGGQNWTMVHEEVGSTYYGSRWANIDGTTIYAYFGQLTILKSIDAGQNWSVVSHPHSSNTAGLILGMDFIDANRGVISGTGDANARYVLSTTDGGENWTEELLSGTGDIELLNQDTAIMSVGGIFRNTNMNLAEVSALNGEPIGKVYPNPATDQLSIQLSVQADGLQLLNMQGQVVQLVSIQNGKADLNRETVENGTYLFQILHQNNIVGTGKVVLQ